MAQEITGLLDSPDGQQILVTQIVTEMPSMNQKRVAYLDMQRVNNGTLGLEVSQARTVLVHGKDCSKTCLQITNILMDSDGTSSPAMAAGLKKGDIITKCGRDDATSINSLLTSVREAQHAKMKFLVLEYCRLSRFGFLQRDLEDARADIEEQCYQTGLQHMLNEYVDSRELANLTPAELYALFPSPFARNAGSIVPHGNSLAWSGRVVQTQRVATPGSILQFRSGSSSSASSSRGRERSSSVSVTEEEQSPHERDGQKRGNNRGSHTIRRQESFFVDSFDRL